MIRLLKREKIRSRMNVDDARSKVISKVQIYRLPSEPVLCFRMNRTDKSVVRSMKFVTLSTASSTIFTPYSCLSLISHHFSFLIKKTKVRYKFISKQKLKLYSFHFVFKLNFNFVYLFPYSSSLLMFVFKRYLSN